MKLHNLLFALAIAAAGAVRAHSIAGDVAYGARIPPTQIGISLGLGGGVTNFAASEMTDVANVGGTWEVRATVGTRLFLAGEVAYVGSRRNIDLTGVTGSSAGETPHIFTHGIEGTARVQYPYLTGSWLVEPFAFGGLGWTHLGVDASVSPTSAIRTTSDDILVVPFGGGLSAAWNGLLFEGRFTYRPAFNEDLLRKPDGTIASLSNWSVGGLVGYEF
jgi:hypothetical protein